MQTAVAKSLNKLWPIFAQFAVNLSHKMTGEHRQAVERMDKIGGSLLWGTFCIRPRFPSEAIEGPRQSVSSGTSSWGGRA